MKKIQKLVKVLLFLLKGKSEKEKKEIISQFLRYLEKRKKLYLAYKILKIIKREEKKEEVVLELAHSLKKRIIDEILKRNKDFFGKKEVRIKYNENLIGGFILRDENYKIDVSVNSLISKIFKNI